MGLGVDHHAAGAAQAWDATPVFPREALSLKRRSRLLWAASGDDVPVLRRVRFARRERLHGRGDAGPSVRDDPARAPVRPLRPRRGRRSPAQARRASPGVGHERPRPPQPRPRRPHARYVLGPGQLCAARLARARGGGCGGEAGAGDGGLRGRGGARARERDSARPRRSGRSQLRCRGARLWARGFPKRYSRRTRTLHPPAPIAPMTVHS
mmetsp:Transcript_17670/g.57785  ORF Transcript_17670/g.57785 Transcript_17670/m.57785 type:complete len:210 (+) Transcript_17670:1018-1647(+)